ncbi:uncharacterized protein LOC117784756 [Drosophila innubila]|uniref:uncharacterized protein LOC117784756 n=1 Tax=Drosophila innubila TaxID=198719 RepID=UPI00148DC91B|nr:uncharacterized protein LOC117784756 [Drosophila innubila]
MENYRRSQKPNDRSTRSKKQDDNRLRQLRLLMMKLPMTDQLLLYRNHDNIQLICEGIWRNSYKRLDFRQLGRELCGEPLSYFLNKMMDNFRYVYFTADRLQDNLNMLEHAGIKALNNVQHCELLMSSESLPKRSDENGSGDAGLGRVIGIAAVLGGSTMPQWPLHALPKMLRNLRRLKVHCEVQVHFIEQFPLLELLVLHGDVAQSALTGILERCKQLKRLFIKFKKLPAHLQGIDNCSRLQDLSLPMTLFQQARDQILSLPLLHLLELTGGQQTPEMTIECLRHVIGVKSNAIEIIQLNCACFDSPFWIQEATLGRCHRLQGLVLNNCCFDDREINDLHIPRVVNYLVLSGCPDLKEYQLVDIIKICPRLSELYLIDCPQLSGKVLHDIYRIRCSEKLDYPISIILSRCDTVGNDYQEAYVDYWYYKLSVLKLDRLLEENRPIEELQIFFYKSRNEPLK